jgi:hypothetical protein
MSSKKQALLFVNKKKQKNFFNLVRGRLAHLVHGFLIRRHFAILIQAPRTRVTKVFWFFFSKKNRLYLSLQEF